MTHVIELAHVRTELQDVLFSVRAGLPFRPCFVALSRQH